MTLLDYLPAAITLVGVAVAWGRSETRLADLHRVFAEHRDESRARDEARATEQRAIASDVREARETLARTEERHGALAGRVARLEEVDTRHDQEIRDARHAAKESAQQVELLAGRVDRLENATRTGARPRR